MKMLKMCLNWKVLVGLAVVGAGIYLVAPELALEALPVLLLALCPLSMMIMMWGMRGEQDDDASLTHEEKIARLRARQAELDDQIGALEREEPRPTANGHDPRGSRRR